jgi:hypothetical protein
MMAEHTEVGEKDGVSAVRRHLAEEHGIPGLLMSAVQVRNYHGMLHRRVDLEWGPQNPPMPDLMLEVMADPGEPPIDWDLEQVAYDHFESRRDREGS